MDIYSNEGRCDSDLVVTISNNLEVECKFTDAIAELFHAMRLEYQGSNTKIPLAWAKSSVKIYKSGAPAENQTVPLVVT